MYLTKKKWSALEGRLKKKLEDDNFLKKLNERNDLKAYQSPSGRITYNKIVGANNFAQFTDLITAIIPLETALDSDNNHRIPSIAKVLKYNHVNIYPTYLYMNASMEEFMDYEAEENQENMDELLDSLDGNDEPIIGIAVFKSEHMKSAHAVAFITWKTSRTKYNFAYYDSLSYKKGKGSFDYAERTFISSNFEKKINFMALSEYCFHKTPEEFHCSQYVINAEYCYVYAVYFLFQWINHGKALNKASFKTVVESTYIVSPESLSRANNKDSMIYRVIMMAFIVKSLACFFSTLTDGDKEVSLDCHQHLSKLQKYLDDFEKYYGFFMF